MASLDFSLRHNCRPRDSLDEVEDEDELEFDVETEDDGGAVRAATSLRQMLMRACLLRERCGGVSESSDVPAMMNV